MQSGNTRRSGWVNLTCRRPQDSLYSFSGAWRMAWSNSSPLTPCDPRVELSHPETVGGGSRESRKAFVSAAADHVRCGLEAGHHMYAAQSSLLSRSRSTTTARNLSKRRALASIVPILLLLSEFRKIKRDLWDHLAVCRPLYPCLSSCL
jgi:hypothetical protein